MNKQTQITLSFLAVAVIVGLAVFISTPHSYEDCILANIDKATTPQSSRLVYRACSEKFTKYTDGSISIDEMYGTKK